jgi:hypothetical protein
VVKCFELLKILAYGQTRVVHVVMTCNKRETHVIISALDAEVRTCIMKKKERTFLDVHVQIVRVCMVYILL